MKKIGKIILIVILVFLVVREFISVELTLYKGAINSTTSVSNNVDRMYLEKYDDNTAGLIDLDNYQIVYDGLDESKTVDLSGTESQIDVSIDKELEVGLTRYIPLYKPISFSSNASYSWEATFENKDSLIIVDVSGSVDVSGEQNIYGVCSGKRAKRLIEEKINREIKKAISTNVENELKIIALKLAKSS